MRNELYGIGVFILAMWLVFAVDLLIPAALTEWGLRPRTMDGLLGVVLMPFLHGSLGHILANTVPLVVLLMLLSGSRVKNWEIVIAIVLISGLLLWVFGRSAIHVGASGLVFGLIAFLIISGVLEKRLVPLVVSLLVGVMYGSSLLYGLIPSWGSNVSWDGHLCGVIAGALVAYGMTQWSKSERAMFAGKN